MGVIQAIKTALTGGNEEKAPPPPLVQAVEAKTAEDRAKAHAELRALARRSTAGDVTDGDAEELQRLLAATGLRTADFSTMCEVLSKWDALKFRAGEYPAARAAAKTAREKFEAAKTDFETQSKKLQAAMMEAQAGVSRAENRARQAFDAVQLAAELEFQHGALLGIEHPASLSAYTVRFRDQVVKHHDRRAPVLYVPHETYRAEDERRHKIMDAFRAECYRRHQEAVEKFWRGFQGSPNERAEKQKHAPRLHPVKWEEVSGWVDEIDLKEWIDGQQMRQFSIFIPTRIFDKDRPWVPVERPAGFNPYAGPRAAADDGEIIPSGKTLLEGLLT